MVIADGCSTEFEVEAGVLQGDTLAPYQFAIVVGHVLRVAIPDNNTGLMTQKHLSRHHLVKYVIDFDFADEIVLLSGTMTNVQTLFTAGECSSC